MSDQSEPVELKPSEKPLINAGRVRVPDAGYNTVRLPNLIDILKNS